MAEAFGTPFDATAHGRPGGLFRVLQDLGLTNARNMYWWRSDAMNFGDWIGPLLYRWRRGLAPIYYRNDRPKRRGTCLYSVGSILHEIRVPGRAVVWGAGLLNGAERFARPARIHAVRGPLTRAACLEQGYECPEVYGDPGILLPHVLPEEAQGAARTGEIAVVPHFSNWDSAVASFGGREGYRMVDVRRPVAAVVADILACDGVLSSSLHGLITAHAYGRPGLWVEFSDGAVRSTGGAFKFRDYYLGCGIETPPQITPIGGQESDGDIRRMLAEAPLPDMTGRAERLLETCPF